MMAVVVGCFMACWLPFSIMFILFPTNKEALAWFEENPARIEVITWIGNRQAFTSDIFLLSGLLRLFQFMHESNNLCCHESWNQESSCGILPK